MSELAVMETEAMEAVGETPVQQPRILVLEDEARIQFVVKAMLGVRRLGCDVAGTLAQARQLMARTAYDILFVDVNLPDGVGLAVGQGGGLDAPLMVVMTGAGNLETAIESIRSGATDFIPKPFTVGQFLQRVDKVVEEWRTRRSLRMQAQMLDTLVRIKTDELSRSLRQVDEVHDATVTALVAALKLKDHDTADHCARVSRNSVVLGSFLGLSEFELRNLRWGAYLHDVGKIGVPESILLKESELTEDELVVLRRHPQMGCSMIRTIEFLRFTTDVVLSHHERWDGSGYPHGLAGTAIPLNARIFAVLDALDAMSADRPYRSALPLAAAKAELVRMSGVQFDPEIVELFITTPDSRWVVQGAGARQARGNEGTRTEGSAS